MVIAHSFVGSSIPFHSFSILSKICPGFVEPCLRLSLSDRYSIFTTSLLFNYSWLFCEQSEAAFTEFSTQEVAFNFCWQTCLWAWWWIIVSASSEARQYFCRSKLTLTDPKLGRGMSPSLYSSLALTRTAIETAADLKVGVSDFRNLSSTWPVHFTWAGKETPVVVVTYWVVF